MRNYRGSGKEIAEMPVEGYDFTLHQVFGRDEKSVRQGKPSKSKLKKIALIARMGGRCLNCGTNRRLTIDHIIPRIMGGSSLIDNVQPLCYDCNYEKDDLAVDYRPRHLRRQARREMVRTWIARRRL